jgi:hypothetical protein
MIVCLLALIAGIALLSTGIGNPVREAVGFVCGALTLCFAVSFVMAAFTSAGSGAQSVLSSVGGPRKRRYLCPGTIESFTSSLLGQRLSWAWHISCRGNPFPGPGQRSLPSMRLLVG